MFDFLQLKNSVKSLAGERASLRAQIEEKKLRHEYLQTAPRHPEDLADLVDEIISASSARWPERLLAQLELLRRKPLLEVDLKQAFPLLAVVGKSDSIVSPGHLEAALLSIFGDPIRRAIREQILSSSNASQSGPRLAERKRELAELDAEIAALEEREQQLVDEAHAAGIRLG